MRGTRLQQEVDVRIGVLLHNSGGTYRSAGEESGLSPQTISAWDRGIRNPRQDSLEKLRAVS
jgi:transcriptional regulator with XRE-family HTH domain